MSLVRKSSENLVTSWKRMGEENREKIKQASREDAETLRYLISDFRSVN